MSNDVQRRMAGKECIESQIKKEKWKWIGHAIRKNQDDIGRETLSWNPQAQRRRGRPKIILVYGNRQLSKSQG